MDTKCIVCGKEVDRSTVICDECKKEPNRGGHTSSVKIRKCPNCGSIFVGEWLEKGIKERDVVNLIIQRVFEVHDSTFKISGDEYNRKVSFKGVSDQGGKEKEGQFFLHTSLSTCPVCTKKLGNYYEAILQLRGERGERLDFVLRELLEEIEGASSREIFLTKLDRKKEGYDLLLSDKQFARAIARKAVERFGGTFRETSHLVGMKKGTELYRITVSIRIPPFQKSDIIKVGREIFVIVSIKLDTVNLINLKTRTREKIKIMDLKNYSVYKAEERVRDAYVLYRQGSTIYILDPFDFKERAVTDSESKDKVRVVKIEDEILVVPPL